MTAITAAVEHAEGAQEGRSVLPNLLLLGWSLVAAVAGIMAMGNPSLWQVCLGAAASAIVTLPATQRGYTAYGPWTLVIAITYVACGIRPMYVLTGDSPGRSVDELFLLGQPPEFFLDNGLVYLLGIALFTAGYIFAGPEKEFKGSPLRILSKPVLGPSTPVVVLLCALIGLAALYMYVSAAGGVNLSDFSSKARSGGTEISQDYESHGVARSLTQFSVVAFWLHVAYSLRPGNKIRLLSTEVVAGVLLFILSCLFPIITNARSDIAYTVFVALAIASLLKRPPKLIALLLVTVVGIGVINFLTLSRGSSTSEVELSDVLAVSVIEESVIYNRNFADLYNASHIIANTPEVLPSANGSTITGWLAAPIPRALWPEKPLVNPGPIVGEYIYGNGRSGVPPGIVAEMWWNWQWPGIVVGTFVGGILVGLVSRLKNISSASTAWIALFGGGLLRFGAFALTSGIGGALFKSLEASVYMFLAVSLCAIAAGAFRSGVHHGAAGS
ncbi:oligosaccharide repeat unit polymerase [Kytococcus aerolatus]|uniref:Oligosaccharide repeat unit polymerase n=1 Tax=Kytococcus aerolatus TaxID=592308 RepID=A0A212T6S5_9MICO|nr:O-antigen polymerase [Kytococcus aerolatus]SNC61763.1 oligosaccharide repeat unit polymerase [Kytococcus aerolatus]